jgi:hypothetical protein
MKELEAGIGMDRIGYLVRSDSYCPRQGRDAFEDDGLIR